jgi:hypothetical protein
MIDTFRIAVPLNRDSSRLARDPNKLTAQLNEFRAG